MRELDKIAAANRRHWEWAVRKGAGCTIPWLHLDPALLRAYAAGELATVPELLDDIYPHSVLAGLEGKSVLCLACGGGQQSAVFGLLGAKVTVLDLTESQLDGDRTAATHYGYELNTILGDMRDLSGLADESFDLVYQGNSMSWVPDAREVYAGVVRVLRGGGVYRTDFSNPASEFVEISSWDGQGYRLSEPYAQTEWIERLDPKAPASLQFRHHMSEIFGGLMGVDLQIEQVQDSPHYFRDHHAEPGTWGHSLEYLGGFAVVSRKRTGG